MLLWKGGGEMAGTTTAEGGACLSAAFFVRRNSFSHELHIRWEGKMREYWTGELLEVDSFHYPLPLIPSVGLTLS